MKKNSNESLRPEQELGVLGSHPGELNLQKDKNLMVPSILLSPSLPVQSLSQERKMGIGFLREHFLNIRIRAELLTWVL